MLQSPLVILGSSHSHGHTRSFCHQVLSVRKEIPLVDLQSYYISPYNPHVSCDSDDFLPLMQKIIQEHDSLVLASPIYWYSVSAVLKTFLDRWTDLLIRKKEMGRALRGKKMMVLSTMAYRKHLDLFEAPLQQTAAYMGMPWNGCFFWCPPEGDSVANREALRAAQDCLSR